MRCYPYSESITFSKNWKTIHFVKLNFTSDVITIKSISADIAVCWPCMAGRVPLMITTKELCSSSISRRPVLGCILHSTQPLFHFLSVFTAENQRAKWSYHLQQKKRLSCKYIFSSLEFYFMIKEISIWYDKYPISYQYWFVFQILFQMISNISKHKLINVS